MTRLGVCRRRSGSSWRSWLKGHRGLRPGLVATGRRWQRAAGRGLCGNRVRWRGPGRRGLCRAGAIAWQALARPAAIQAQPKSMLMVRLKSVSAWSCRPIIRERAAGPFRRAASQADPGSAGRDAGAHLRATPGGPSCRGCCVTVPQRRRPARRARPGIWRVLQRAGLQIGLVPAAARARRVT